MGTQTKLLSLISIILLIGSFTSNRIMAQSQPDESYIIPFTSDDENDNTDDKEEKNGNHGQRTNKNKIILKISNVRIIAIDNNIDVNDIESYEIWKSDNSLCLGIEYSEKNFLEQLFSLNGSFIIKIKLNEEVFSGEISI